MLLGYDYPAWTTIVRLHLEIPTLDPCVKTKKHRHYHTMSNYRQQLQTASSIRTLSEPGALVWNHTACTKQPQRMLDKPERTPTQQTSTQTPKSNCLPAPAAPWRIWRHQSAKTRTSSCSNRPGSTASSGVSNRASLILHRDARPRINGPVYWSMLCS